MTQQRPIAVAGLQRPLTFKLLILAARAEPQFLLPGCLFLLLLPLFRPLLPPFILPSLSVNSGLIKAIVVPLLQYHVGAGMRGYQHTKPPLAEAREREEDDPVTATLHRHSPLLLLAGSSPSLGGPSPTQLFERYNSAFY